MVAIRAKRKNQKSSKREKKPEGEGEAKPPVIHKSSNKSSFTKRVGWHIELGAN